MKNNSTISVINYNSQNFEQKKISSLDDISQYQKSDETLWVVIENSQDIGTLEKIQEMFTIHRSTIKSISSLKQRPKFEQHKHYLHISFKSLISEDKEFNTLYEQINMLVFENLVITFKEKDNDLFDPIYHDIKKSKHHIRENKADYLSYTILDFIIHKYYDLLDTLDEAIVSIENSLINDEELKLTPIEIKKLIKEVITIKRNTIPMNALIKEIQECKSQLISEHTKVYLKDISNHLSHVTETIESHSEVLSKLLDIHSSIVSYKMNDVMQLLTLFSAIFIPLTFIAGIYGMNFEHMPELKEEWAYGIVWLIFITMPIVMLIYFKKKKWL